MATVLRLKRARCEETPENIIASAGKRLCVFRKLAVTQDIMAAICALPQVEKRPQEETQDSMRKRIRENEQGIVSEFREIGRRKTVTHEIVDVERIVYQSEILCNGKPMMASQTIPKGEELVTAMDVEMEQEDYDLYEETTEDVYSRRDIPFCTLEDSDSTSEEVSSKFNVKSQRNIRCAMKKHLARRA